MKRTTTTREYDGQGKVVKEAVTEETTNDEELSRAVAQHLSLAARMQAR